MAVGDINADGKNDIVTVGSNAAVVLLSTTNSGATAATFLARQVFTIGTGPTSLALADLNGDGRPDIVATAKNNNQVSVLLNTTAAGSSTVTMAPLQLFATGQLCYNAAVADVNGDGKPDVVTTNRNDGTISVLLNATPTGAAAAAFLPRQDFDATMLPVGLALVDVNGDGKPDAVTGNPYGTARVSVLLNTTATGSTTAAFATPQTFSAGAFAVNLAVGDLDGDGRPDLVANNRNGTSVTVLRNTTPTGAAAASFDTALPLTTAASPASLAVLDLNGDGKPDVFAPSRNSPNVLSVLVNTTTSGGGLSFAAKQDTATGGNNQIAVTAGDLNADGKPDVLVIDNINGPVVMMNTTAMAAPFTFNPDTATGTITDQMKQPAFTGLSSHTVTYGTGAVTFTGTLRANPGDVPAPGSVSVTVSGNGITPLTGTGSLDGSGNFAATLNTGGLASNGTPYTVTYSYAAQGYFRDANDSATTLTVNKAALTVTADSKTKTYGDTDPPLTYLITSGSLFNGDTLSGALGRTAGATVGTYAITQGGLTAGTNYTLTYIGANFTITPKAASVTPNAASKVYGAADPAFTGGTTGFLPGDNVTATYTRAAGETVAGGPYLISATLSPTGVLSNYDITYNTANFTINRATLTIAADANPSTAAVDAFFKVFGRPDPALTYRATGFRFTDTAGTVLSGSLTRDPGEGIGAYAVKQGSLVANSNYGIQFTDGVLNITPLGGSVVSTQVDDGNVQRSMVRSLTVTFASPITAGDIPAVLAQMSLKRASDNLLIGLLATLDTTGTKLTLKFAGPSIIGGSLADGRYALTYGTQVLGSFHRLFGDLDGDRDVDALDAAVMSLIPNNTRRGISPKYNEYLDYNSNGIIATDDKAQLNLRLGTSI